MTAEIRYQEPGETWDGLDPDERGMLYVANLRKNRRNRRTLRPENIRKKIDFLTVDDMKII